MTIRDSADALIVGAGLSGLTAARALVEQGLTPWILEREDRAGGRLATEPFGQGWADYGAQYFTAQGSTFQAWVDRWQQSIVGNNSNWSICGTSI